MNDGEFVSMIASDDDSFRSNTAIILVWEFIATCFDKKAIVAAKVRH